MGRSQADQIQGAAGVTNPSGSSVDVDALVMAFATKQGEFEAVRDVSLQIPTGQFAAIVGPSGCGKSTILNALAGLLPTTEGEVRIDSTAVDHVRRDVAYLFQRDALLPWKTVLGNVMLPLQYRNVPKTEATQRARDWLHRVHLEGFEGYYPHQLSGGMKKRVALATVFVYRPRLLLMDEPFGALDVQTRNLMENELLELWNEERPTVLFVTHDLEEAIGLADRVIVFTAGPGRVKSDYTISLPRPRHLNEIRFNDSFRNIYRSIWEDLRSEVLAAYAATERVPATI